MKKHISQDYPLILASSSPRRRELLSSLKIPFLVIPSNVEEKKGKDDPERFAKENALIKAKDVSFRIKDRWILGADTIVVLGRRIIGKPKDREDAKRMLRQLSGKNHTVITAFCIIDPEGEVAHLETVKTEVWIKELTEEEIEGYLETGEPFDKAGSYAAQGIGAFMIKKIRGSYTNVVGLPLSELIDALKKVGAIKKFP